MKDKLEMIEVWQPVKEGGQAIKQDGTSLKRVAILINGYPIFLEKDFYIEKRQLTKEESEQITNSFKINK